MYSSRQSIHLHVLYTYIYSKQLDIHRYHDFDRAACLTTGAPEWAEHQLLTQRQRTNAVFAEVANGFNCFNLNTSRRRLPALAIATATPTTYKMVQQSVVCVFLIHINICNLRLVFTFKSN